MAPVKKKKSVRAKRFVPQIDIAESIIDTKLSSDASRRFQQALNLLLAIDSHSISKTSHPEDDDEESIAIATSALAYIYQSYLIPEKMAVSEFKNMYKKMSAAQNKLGSRASALDVFTEIAIGES